MFDVRFAGNAEANADDYHELVQDAVRRGCEYIAAHPARALSGFSIEVVDDEKDLIFEVVFHKLGQVAVAH